MVSEAPLLVSDNKHAQGFHTILHDACIRKYPVSSREVEG